MNNLQQYSDMADVWWDEAGPFQDLIHLNPVRFSFFDRHMGSWKDKKVLDLGCGGGFVAEELARRGAHVVGVDPAQVLLGVARSLAEKSSLRIDYRVGSGERIPADDADFDVVVCVDVLEHVADLDQVLTEVRRVLKPQGLFLYDTINRTVHSFLWMIVALEWIAGRIPRGTHDWKKFIRPSELNARLAGLGFSHLSQAGIRMSGIGIHRFNLKPKFALCRRMSGVYTGAAVRL